METPQLGSFLLIHISDTAEMDLPKSLSGILGDEKVKWLSGGSITAKTKLILTLMSCVTVSQRCNDFVMHCVHCR